ncbi:MAG: hypothetical protein HQL31_14160 [Planctomycetes bacterium]|nr:hypothetical protein [Planctomycetota bacterium]
MGEADRICKSAGVPYISSIIYPAPLETEQTRKETFELLCRLRPTGVNIMMPLLVRNTVWHRKAEKFGFRWDRPERADLDMINYTTRILYPQALWDPLPYSVNGDEFRDFAKKSSDFTLDLNDAGLETSIVDATLVLAELAGLTATAYQDRTRRLFSTGDYEGLADFAKNLNRKIQSYGERSRPSGSCSVL